MLDFGRDVGGVSIRHMIFSFVFIFTNIAILYTQSL